MNVRWPAMIAQQIQPYLPVEIWSRVLHHVDDDYTLWVICRQVSQTFRAEAEHEFVLKRLSTLDISWLARGRAQHQDRLLYYHCRVLSIQFQNLIEDSARAQFSAQFQFNFHHDDIPIDDHEWIHCDCCKDIVVGLMAFRDLDFEERSGERYHASQTATLGSYCNEAELPGLMVDTVRKTFAFDWKAFLNDFFRITTYVETRNQVKDRVRDRAEQSLNNLRHPPNSDDDTSSVSVFEYWCKWPDTFEEEDDDRCTEAYFRRMQSVRNKAGFPLDLANITEKTRKYQRLRFSGRRVCRNHALFDELS